MTNRDFNLGQHKKRLYEGRFGYTRLIGNAVIAKHENYTQFLSRRGDGGLQKVVVKRFVGAQRIPMTC